jgi:hypothetical protein
MFHREKAIWRSAAIALVGALVLFAAENVQGFTDEAAGSGLLHAHHHSQSPYQSGSQQPPMHTHTSAVDHCAHSHFGTIPLRGDRLAVEEAAELAVSDYVTLISRILPFDIEHPPRF